MVVVLVDVVLVDVEDVVVVDVMVVDVVDFVKPHGKQVMLFSYTSLQNWPVFSQTAARSNVTSEHCDGWPILFRSGSGPSCRSVVVVEEVMVVVVVEEEVMVVVVEVQGACDKFLFLL